MRAHEFDPRDDEFLAREYCQECGAKLPAIGICRCWDGADCGE